jgi:Zn-dependent peptidase ImmA (M78 family)
MPEHPIKQELSHIEEIDIIDDDVMKRLAAKFGPSLQAMMFRRANLG